MSPDSGLKIQFPVRRHLSTIPKLPESANEEERGWEAGDQLGTMNRKCSRLVHPDVCLQANVVQVALTCLIKAVLTSHFLLNMHTRKLFEI